MMTKYDEGVIENWRISHGIYIVKKIDETGLEDEIKKLKTMPLHLVCFVLSNDRRIMNNFIDASNGSYTDDVNYTDTDSLYIEKNNGMNNTQVVWLEKTIYTERMNIKMQV